MRPIKINAILTLMFGLMLNVMFGQNINVNIGGAKVNISTSSSLVIEGDLKGPMGSKLINQGAVSVHGDLENNAGDDFISDMSGELKMLGDHTDIGGPQQTVLHILTLGDNINLTASANLTIKGGLNLGNGVLDIQGNAITLDNLPSGGVQATDGHIKQDATGSIINKQSGLTSMEFPLGSGSKRNLTITPTVAEFNEFSAVYIDDDPNLDGYNTLNKDAEIAAINPNYYFKVNRVSGSHAVTMRFEYDQDEDGTYHSLAYWDIAQAKWKFVAQVSSGMANGHNFMQTSNWNNFSDTVFALVEVSTGYSAPFPVDEDRNWVYSRTYDVDGNITAESMEFTDNSGRVLQSQTKNIDKQEVVAATSIFDQFGRAAVQSMSAPTNSALMGYKEGFMKSAFSGNDFDYTDFTGSNRTNPAPVQNGEKGTVGFHYSNYSEETFQTTTGYPYSQSQYLPQPGATVSKIAGAGLEFKMGSGRESYTFQMVASKAETEHLFGTDKGFLVKRSASDPLVNEVLSGSTMQTMKTVTIDAEGKEGVSFESSYGPVATALSNQAIGCTGIPVSLEFDEHHGFNFSGDIHLSPAVHEFFVHAPVYEYVPVDAPPNTVILYKGLQLQDISLRIVDLKNNYLLVEGTDYNIVSDGIVDPFKIPGQHKLKVTLLGSYANSNYQAEVLRIGIELDTSKPASYYETNIFYNTSINYTNEYERYSKVYYDLAGQMRRTTPEKAISCSSPASDAFYTSYDYDHYGRQIAVRSPDEGTKKIRYDEEGKVRFTQNSVQAANDRFSYINYDKNGNSIETGEYQSTGTSIYFQDHYGLPAPPTGATGTDDILDQLDGLDDANCSYRSFMMYHEVEAAAEIPSSFTHASSYEQHHLMGKLAKTYNDEGETWYSYNRLGQAEYLVQRINDATYQADFPSVDDQIKTIDYTYDRRGRMTSYVYQDHHSSERVEQQFAYNENDRLTEVQAAYNTRPLSVEQRLQYNLNGSVRRSELGDDLQGLDYTYTLHGQLKSINHPNLDGTNDPGMDGVLGAANGGFTSDLFGITYDYYQNDYSRLGVSIESALNSSNSIYSGNIAQVRYKTSGANDIIRTDESNTTLITASTDQLINQYRYDQYNQLIESKFGVFDNNTNTAAMRSDYEVTINYRNNVPSQIQTLTRKGYQSSVVPLVMDELAYTHHPSNHQLMTIMELGSYGDYGTDYTVDPALLMAHYFYNANGQLISNTEQGSGAVNNMEYYPGGQTRKVTFPNGNTAEYFYSDRGHKVRSVFTDVSVSKSKTTWYISDAGGTVLSVYEKDELATLTSTQLTEQPLYGSGRIGSYGVATNEISYEITDHQGNVRVTFTDVDGVATVNSWQDYYPNGMVMPGRSYNNSTYRYGYQGQEKAENSHWDHFELRMWNSHLGRWLSPDPYGQYQDPYLGMGNNPVNGSDPDGGYFWEPANRFGALKDQRMTNLRFQSWININPWADQRSPHWYRYKMSYIRSLKKEYNRKLQAVRYRSSSNPYHIYGTRLYTMLFGNSPTSSLNFRDVQSQSGAATAWFKTMYNWMYNNMSYEISVRNSPGQSDFWGIDPMEMDYSHSLADNWIAESDAKLDAFLARAEEFAMMQQEEAIDQLVNATEQQYDDINPGPPADGSLTACGMCLWYLDPGSGGSGNIREAFDFTSKYYGRFFSSAETALNFITSQSDLGRGYEIAAFVLSDGRVFVLPWSENISEGFGGRFYLDQYPSVFDVSANGMQVYDHLTGEYYQATELWHTHSSGIGASRTDRNMRDTHRLLGGSLNYYIILNGILHEY